MKVKNILFIEANLDGTVGGSHYCLLEIVKGINKKKFKPIVLFYQDNFLIPEFKKVCEIIIMDRGKGFIIKKDLPKVYAFLEKKRALLTFALMYQKVYNFLRYFIWNFFKIIYLLLKFKIDIVHMNNSPGLTDWLLGSKIVGCKCIAHLRGNWEPSTMQKKLVKYYDKVISISNGVTKYVKQKGVYIDNFILVQDGIDINSVISLVQKSKKEIKREFKKDFNNSPMISVIGNIKPWKGQHTAIKAIKILIQKYPDLTCLIVGDVSKLQCDLDYFEYLKRLVKDNGLEKNIIFTGLRKDIGDIISASDLLVHTSVEPEPFGRVILEGMVFSKCVIATAQGGPLEIVEDGISGFLFPPNDVITLAKKIDYLLANQDVAQNVGRAARRRVEECFSIEKNVKRIEEIYCNLLN